MATTTRQRLGRWGEDLAARHLAAAGATVLDRNWRCRAGELDLVVLDGDVLVAVEVKTRSGRGFGTPAEGVGPRKVARLRRLAAAWLAEHAPTGVRAVRIDVVGVERDPSGREAPLVVHLRDVG